jgi:Domain of unknown function (DUF4124)
MRSLLLALALFAWGSPGLAHAAEGSAPPRIYRWVDENGIAHYTTDPARIPRSLRRRYGLPAEPMKSERLDARAPRPEAAPAPSPDAWAAQERSETPTPRPAQEWDAGTPTDVAAMPSVGASPDRLAQIELRIAELSAAIAADEDALSGRIAAPATADTIALADEPAFREIALRLPKRLAELEALQRERDTLQSAVP